MKLADIGLPDLTEEQFEEVCAVAEEAARKHIFSKVPAKQVDNLDICIEAEGEKPLNLSVEVDLVLSATAQGIKQKILVDEAVAEAFKAIENYLRKLT